MATPVGQLTIEMAADIVRLQKDMEGARKTVDGAMQSITKTVQSAMNTVGALFAGVSIGAFGGKLISVEREFGKLNASLVTVTGSAREADAAFVMLTNFANTTPFSLQEVTQAFIKLKAMGLDPSKEALTSYGNTASAMGKSLNQMIEAVADASTGQFERLLEFGIKSKSEGDKVTFLFRGISTTIGKNSDEIVGYLKNIGLVDFAGGMLRQSATLDGAISNLAGAWDGLFATINNEMSRPLLMASVKGAESAIIGLSAVVKNFTQFMEENRVALMAFAAILAGPAIVSGIGAATAAFIALRTAVVGLTLAFASNPIALAILAITAAAVPAIVGIQNYMNANAELEKEQAKLNQSQAETERLLRQAEPVKAKAVVSTKALTDADKERAKELKKQEDAYTKLLNDINDKTGAMLLEQQGTEKLSDSQKLALKIMQDIQSGTLKLNDSQKIRITQSLEELLATEKVSAEMKDMAKTQQAAIDLSNKLNDEQWKTVDSLRSSVVSLIEQNDELRYGKEAVAQRQIAVMRATAADLEFVAANEGGNAALEEQARLLRQQADLAEDNSLLTAAKDAEAAFKKTSEIIESSLTDALMRGFESGKDFGKNLADTLVNLFKTLVLKPIIQPIAQGGANFILGMMGMGATGSAAASGAAGGGGSFSMSALGSAAGQYISSAIFGNSAAYGAAIGTTSIGAGSQAAMLAAQTGEFGFAGLSATAGSAGTTSSMAATAMQAMPYVAAALVAANALGLMRSDRIVGGGLTGTLGAGDIQSYDLRREGGTLFSGPDYSLANQRVSEMSEYLQTSFTDMRNAAVAMGENLGLSTEHVRTFTMALGDVQVHPDIAQLGLVLDGLTDEQKQEKLQSVLIAAQERMAELVLLGTDFQRVGETFSDTLVRLSAIQNVSTYLNEFGGAFTNFATASVTARQGIIDLAGGLDQLVQKTEGFIANFYTREEQAAITAKGVVSALTNAGFTASQIAALETRADLRTLLESIDVNTVSGQRQFVAILDLQQQFADIQPVLEEQNANLYSLIEASPQVEILQRMFETDAAYQDRVAQAEEVANALYVEMVDGIHAISTSIETMTSTLANRMGEFTTEASAVINAYASIGRTVEQSPFAIDAEGFNNWMTAVREGIVALDDLPSHFYNAVIASVTADPNSAYAIAFRAGQGQSYGETGFVNGRPYDGPYIGGFASGGYMTGPALVGEHGPELFDPRTSQIYTAPATSNIFGGNEVAAEIRALRDEVTMMRSETRSTAVNTAKIARLQDNWDVRGLTVKTDADQPLDTVTV